MPLPILVAEKFDDLPDFVRFQLISEWRHDRPWPAPVDGVEDHRIGGLINPIVVGQVGPYRAFCFMSVARIAPSPKEDRLAFFGGFGVARIWIAELFFGRRGQRQCERGAREQKTT